MRARRTLPALILASTALALWAAASSATTLIRQGLDQLTTRNDLVVQGRVLDIHSYWNAAHTFILTDARVRPARFLKGNHAGDVSCTVMGGSVGDTTTLIVGGPDLVPGSDYVLFLGHGNLPGGEARLTVRDLAQGAFDVEEGRAVSQALGEPLLPDNAGRTDVPGGSNGITLDELVRQVHAQDNR